MPLNITQGTKGTGQDTGSIIRDVDDKVWSSQCRDITAYLYA